MVQLSDRKKEEIAKQADIRKMLDTLQIHQYETQYNSAFANSSYSKASLLESAKPKKVLTSGSRVQFKTEELYKFVYNHGIPTYWERAFICPCIDSETGAPNPLCKICHGTGHGYLTPVKDTYVAIQTQDKGFVFNKALGGIDAGTAKGTFDASADIGAMDRITLPDTTIRQNYMFTISKDKLNTGYFIPYDIRDILLIAAYKDNELIDLVEHKDYEYDNKTHRIKILNENYVGLNVTLMLNITLRYIVTNILRDARYQYNKGHNSPDSYTALPRLAYLKRESIFINNVPLVPDDQKNDNGNPNTLDNADEKNSAAGNNLLNTEGMSGYGLGDA